MSRIFISYKRVDKDKVFKIKEQIESALGEKCWIDLDGIESDAQFKSVIISAINDCEVVLFLYSKAHTQIIDYEKDWTVRELNFAAKKNKRIVFINIDGSPLTDSFEFDYGTKQQVDGRKMEHIIKLCNDLQQWLSINSFENETTKEERIPNWKSSICKRISENKNVLYALSILVLCILVGMSYYSHKATKANNGVVKPIEKRPNISFEISKDERTIHVKVDSVSFNMILVEGGNFLMGAPEEDNSKYSKPQHKVLLTEDYYIAETPVTQALWYAVMKSKPAEDGGWSTQYGVGDSYPAYNISWNNITKEFLPRLNKLMNKSFRLPTEAEWEYAARGGVKSLNYAYSGSNSIDDVAWYDKNSNRKTHPVRLKQPNELGLYDMIGNVWEFCQDWYEPYSDEPQIDPMGPNTGGKRVLRGGSFYEGEPVYGRGVATPSEVSYHHGFRIVINKSSIN